MKIEEGKFYQKRNGEKAGPMTHTPTGAPRDFPWTYEGAEFYYTEEGIAGRGGFPEEDLVCELGPVRTVTRREIVPGEYGIVRVIAKPTNDPFPKHVHVRIDQGLSSADELRSAAMIFSQLAEALDENKGEGE